MLFHRTLALLIVAMACSLLAPVPTHADPTDKTIDAFLAYVNEREGISEKQKNEVHKAVNQLRADPYSRTEAITSALTILYPDYAEAILATDEDDAAEAISLLQPHADSSDKYLAADASFYLARALMNSEHFEQALPLLAKVADELEDYSVHPGSAMYFAGVAHAGILDNKRAIGAFADFLETHPDAPERLRVAAWRQVQMLQAIQEGQLDDVHQRMDYSRRRLHLEETGDLTQTQQKKVVDMLAKLITEQEKKECSNCSGSQNTKQQQESQSQGQKQAQNQGKSSTGGSSQNPNGVVQRSFDNGPASPWSRLRDRSRDPANSAIKEKLPARYRDVVQRYYDRNSGSDKSDK